MSKSQMEWDRRVRELEASRVKCKSCHGDWYRARPGDLVAELEDLNRRRAELENWLHMNKVNYADNDGHDQLSAMDGYAMYLGRRIDRL